MKFSLRLVVFWLLITFLATSFGVNAQAAEDSVEYPAPSQMFWSPNGQFIASVDADGLITIWDVETGQAIHQINEEMSQHYRNSGLAHTPVVNAMSWGPNDEIALVSTDGSVQIWDVREGTRIASLEYPDAPQGQGLGVEAGISDVTWTPDGSMLLVASTLTNFSFWDAQTYQFIEFQESPSSIDLAILKDGRMAVGTLYGVAFFPSYTETEYNIFLTINDETLLGDEVVVVRWSFNGSYLLGITFDGRTYIWDRVTNSRLPVAVVYDLPYLSLSSDTVYIDDGDWTVIQAGGHIARYDFTSRDTVQSADLEDVPLAASWSPYGARAAYITANDPSVLRVEIPFASLAELSRILIRCDLEEDTTRLFSEYIASGNIDRMLQQLELLPETQIPIPCRQDLLDMANVLLQ